MRIVYLLTTLGIGGTERLVLALAERMAARGHEVRIVTLAGEPAEQWPTRLDVVHLEVDRNPLRVLRGLMRGAGVVRRFRPQILHSHNFHGNLFARGIKMAWPPVRVISTVHNEYEGGSARMLALQLTDGLSERSVAVSEAVAERALELGIVPARKCSVISNGIDVAQFTPNAARRARLRAEMGAGEDFIWLTAGRVVPAKDYVNLLRAYFLVHGAAKGTQLWIAGQREGEYAEAMRYLAEELGIDGSVRWLGMRTDMAALLDGADGFVMASAWEGMPLAVAEAMAMRKPLVATGVGGVSELMDKCGLVVPPRNAEALARAMLSIVHTPPEAREFLGGAARERVAEHFNMDAKADAWEAVYREVAREKQ